MMLQWFCRQQRPTYLGCNPPKDGIIRQASPRFCWSPSGTGSLLRGYLGFHPRLYRFVAVGDRKKSSVPLPAPTGIVVTNDGEGKFNVLVEPVKNCSMYEGRAKPDGGTWGTSVFTGDSRHILFDGLTPGAMYTIQIRALGGSTGTSDWSDPVQHRSL
jgi:hypothetical protein